MWIFRKIGSLIGRLMGVDPQEDSVEPSQPPLRVSEEIQAILDQMSAGDPLDMEDDPDLDEMRRNDEAYWRDMEETLRDDTVYWRDLETRLAEATAALRDGPVRDRAAVDIMMCTACGVYGEHLLDADGFPAECRSCGWEGGAI
jgi:hypothetical protein